MKNTNVIVCAGGGGVGKTTTSAALALATARSGARVLVISLDPARRLGDALGVRLGSEPSELTVDSGDGALFGLMPDPNTALTAFSKILFAEDLSAIDRLRHNRVYAALDESVPGLHELVTMHIALQAVDELEIDTVVVDTAPSRNAVDFIDYPRRLAKLLRSRAVGWLAKIGSGAEPSPRHRMGRVERLLVDAVGPAVRDAAGLFAELAKARERFLELNEQAGRLLFGPETKYLLVAAPTSAAQEDVHYLVNKLRGLRLRANAVILNSAYVVDSGWIERLENTERSTAAIRSALATIRDEQRARRRAADRLSDSIALQHPRLPQVRLPRVEVREPREIVSRLALAVERSGGPELWDPPERQRRADRLRSDAAEHAAHERDAQGSLAV
ncbi:MAG: ArsA-related P-loop ATPase [Myxococcota bacterium]